MKKRAKTKISKKVLNALAVLVAVVMGSLYIYAAVADKVNQASSIEDPVNSPYADVSNLEIKTYIDCKQAGGKIHTTRRRSRCYFEGIVYYEVIINNAGKESRIEPENLNTYRDCLRQDGNMNYENSSCKSWNGKEYIYDGPPIKSFEDCASHFLGGEQIGGSIRQCTGPDGTIFTGEYPEAVSR